MSYVAAGISLANIAVLTALISIYTKIYRSSKAIIAISLISFSGLLSLHNIIAVYAYFAMNSLYPEELIPFFIGIHTAELAGLLALLKITTLK